jgi:hypothetical protein
MSELLENGRKTTEIPELQIKNRSVKEMKILLLASMIIFLQ